MKKEAMKLKDSVWVQVWWGIHSLAGMWFPKSFWLQWKVQQGVSAQALLASLQHSFLPGVGKPSGKKVCYLACWQASLEKPCKGSSGKKCWEDSYGNTSRDVWLFRKWIVISKNQEELCMHLRPNIRFQQVMGCFAMIWRYDIKLMWNKVEFHQLSNPY